MAGNKDIKIGKSGQRSVGNSSKGVPVRRGKAKPAPLPPAVDTSFRPEGVEPSLRRKRVKVPVMRFIWLIMLGIVSLFQLICAVSVISADEANRAELSSIFAIFLLVEWAYYFVFCVLFKRRMELELIGFLFSSVSLIITASVSPDKVMTQFVAIMAGLAIYIAMIWFLENTNRVSMMRIPLALAALGFLGITLIIGREVYGAKNWIFIGSFSIQPSELAKIAFIYVGAASLDKLQSMRSLWLYVFFAVGCVGLLFLQKDFGTALIYFATFVILAFMRSGDIRTIILVCAAAVIGAMFIIAVKPHVASRFANYRHIWDYMNEGGFQQTRTIIYALSGGLFGLGVGEGRLRYVAASSEDLIFGIICEELGLLFAVAVLLVFLVIAIYTVRNAKYARSTFYSIAACAAAGMFLIQISLNTFGVTDLLPFTGVTLPFISRGGSSMMCSWGLLAFIKASDIRTYPRVMKELLQQNVRK